jgi:hypothetical protein
VFLRARKGLWPKKKTLSHKECKNKAKEIEVMINTCGEFKVGKINNRKSHGYLFFHSSID